MESIQDRIIGLLRKEGELSTGEISDRVGVYSAYFQLRQLERSKKVVRRMECNWLDCCKSFWSINDEKYSV